MRTRPNNASWLRVRGAVALAAYLVLLFFAHIHVALEAHGHGDINHGSQHQHDAEHDHPEHSADDHQLDGSMAAQSRPATLFAHEPRAFATIVFAPQEINSPAFEWIDDRPKHPPPRSSEQPRSPPLA